MIDKNHCRMNMEDEEEYLDFYDFRKTYENMPGVDIHEPVKEEKNEEIEEVSEGSWEEVDENDIEIVESKIDDSKTSEFEIVDGTTQSFSIVDKPASTTDGFEILDSE